MRKRIAVVVCGWLIFVAGWAIGENKVLVLNGTNWKAFPTSEKIMYTYGFSQGYRQGGLDGISMATRWLVRLVGKWHCTFEGKLSRESTSLSEEEIRAEMNAQVQSEKYPFYGDAHTTVTQYVDTMSVFYSDYRNAPVCWDNALRLSSASLAGRAPTEEELEATRKADALTGCK